MKSNKSTGKFGIPVKYIKIAVDVISPILTKIYNQCIITGSFPDVLKVAEVIPIHKAGPKDICSNYRPISLLSPFAKIFEKCLHFQLYNYFTRNNLLNKNQYGFVKKSSTSDAVLDIYNQILQNLNEKKITCSIFLDLAKAFDCINHDILLKKMEKYGVRGLPLKLFQSYFQNRQQFTSINNVSSHMNNIICGVPQGSTLGPLLFNIYINDLPLTSKLQVRLFADDTNLTASHYNGGILAKLVNNELVHISNWMKINKLTINYTKTEYIIITNKKAKLDYTVKIDQTTIKQSKCIKYLGVLLDDSLSWKPQIDRVSSKMASGCWALYHLRKYVDSKTLLMVYYSIIHSHLNYCLSSWGSASASTLMPINKLQKKALRTITFSNIISHTKPLFFKLQILKINDMYKFEIGKIMHKISNNLYSHISKLFVITDQIHSHNTRQNTKKNYFLPRVHTFQAQKSLHYYGAKLWNEIPKPIKESTFFKFKKELKVNLLSQYAGTH